MNAQKVTTEKLFYNVWVTISKLQDSVTMKRIQLRTTFQRGALHMKEI